MELWGRRRFRRLVKSDVQSLLATSSFAGEARFISEAMLDGLPEPVQRYLRYTGVIGKPFVRRVHLRQKGRMHLASGTPWVPVKAEQWYSVRPPGFVWYATLHIGPVPIVRARDMYLTGEGRMLIKAASLVTVADAKGKEFDQGEMVRYLSEMIWFPSAFSGGQRLFRGGRRKVGTCHPHPSWQDGIRDIILRPRGPTDRVRGTAV